MSLRHRIYRAIARLDQRRPRTGLLALALVAAAAFVAHAASDDPAARAASDRIVSRAEATIKRAGASDPIDSQLVRDAIDELHEALRADPRNDAAYVDLGFCYGLLRDGPTAVDMYTKATRLNPSGANFIELADVYLRVGDPEAALMAANAGLVKDPKNARLYNAKGVALNDLERFGEAAEAFERAIELDPDLAVARSNLNALNSGPSGRGSIVKHAPSQ